VLRDVLQTNAPSMALSATSVPLNLGKDVSEIDPNSSDLSDKCFLEKVNSAPLTRQENWISASIDYGKCIPISEVEAAANSKSSGNLRKYEIYERGIEVFANSKKDLTIDSVAKYLAETFLFLSEKADSANQYHVTAAAQTRFFVTNGSSRGPSKETISVLSLGMGPKNLSEVFTLNRTTDGYLFDGSMKLLYSSGTIGGSSTAAETKDSIVYKLDYNFERLSLSDVGLNGLLYLNVNNDSNWLYFFENSCVGSLFNTDNSKVSQNAAETSSEPKFVGKVKFCEN
jgi:hypothetical protein